MLGDIRVDGPVDAGELSGNIAFLLQESDSPRSEGTYKLCREPDRVGAPNRANLDARLRQIIRTEGVQKGAISSFDET